MPDAMPKLASRIDTKSVKDGGRYLEKMEPRNTRYNETVRADNKRMDRGEKTKPLPRGKRASLPWKKARPSGR
jgi:hypothetical protein